MRKLPSATSKLPPKQITLSCEVVALDSAAKTLDVKLGEEEQRVVLLDQLDVEKDNRAVPNSTAMGGQIFQFSQTKRHENFVLIGTLNPDFSQIL